MDTIWSTRKATPDDADAIAAHAHYLESHASHRPGYAAWVGPRLGSGAYIGWLAVGDGKVIGGAGAVLLDWGPTRANPGGRMARIVCVFVDEAWRRRGIARTLTQRVLRDCEDLGIREFNLAASSDAQPLYAALGFAPYPAEMRRRVVRD